MPSVEECEPNTMITVLVTAQERETILRIRAITVEKMRDDAYWGDVVIELLSSYADRSKSLSDWWVWEKFLATFGTFHGVPVASTWRANDHLDELLTAYSALAAYESFGWFKRWRLRRIQRQAYSNLLQLLSDFNSAHFGWVDRNDFLKFKQSRYT